jgi:hypothetical protein
MKERRFPLVVAGTMVLGVAAIVGGVILMFARCTRSDCINSTIGVVFMALGVLAFLSVVPNMLGLVCFLSAIGFVIFLGLVFTFARKPAGLLPPALFVLLGFAEQDLLRSYYSHPRAPAPVEGS